MITIYEVTTENFQVDTCCFTTQQRAQDFKDDQESDGYWCKDIQVIEVTHGDYYDLIANGILVGDDELDYLFATPEQDGD